MSEPRRTGRASAPDSITPAGTQAAVARARLILARQDRIPVWSLPGVFLLIIGVGYFFTFFDIADIGYAMPAISKQFALSNGESTFVALAVGLIGYAVGSMLIGSLSDRFFLTGMGVGADLNLVSTYLGELAPAGKRGRITTLTFLLGIIG